MIEPCHKRLETAAFTLTLDAVHGRASQVEHACTRLVFLALTTLSLQATRFLHISDACIPRGADPLKTLVLLPCLPLIQICCCAPCSHTAQNTRVECYDRALLVRAPSKTFARPSQALLSTAPHCRRAINMISAEQLCCRPASGMRGARLLSDREQFGTVAPFAAINQYKNQ